MTDLRGYTHSGLNLKVVRVLFVGKIFDRIDQLLH